MLCRPFPSLSSSVHYMLLWSLLTLGGETIVKDWFMRFLSISKKRGKESWRVLSLVGSGNHVMHCRESNLMVKIKFGLEHMKSDL